MKSGAADMLAPNFIVDPLNAKPCEGVDVPVLGFCITPLTLTNNVFAAVGVIADVVPDVTRVKSALGKDAAPLLAAFLSAKYLKSGPPPAPDTFATEPSSFLKYSSPVSVLTAG